MFKRFAERTAKEEGSVQELDKPNELITTPVDREKSQKLLVRSNVLQNEQLKKREVCKSWINLMN